MLLIVQKYFKYSANSTKCVIIAGPLSGKTTILKMYCAFISGYAGKYKKISVVDERKELSSSFDIGINTDIISLYKKAEESISSKNAFA